MQIISLTKVFINIVGMRPGFHLPTAAEKVWKAIEMKKNNSTNSNFDNEDCVPSTLLCSTLSLTQLTQRNVWISHITVFPQFNKVHNRTEF